MRSVVLLWVWVRKGKETWLCRQIAPNLEQCLSWAAGWRGCFTLGTCVKYISGSWDFFSSCVEAVALICHDCSGCQPHKSNSYFPGIAWKTFRNLEDHRQKLRSLSCSSSILRVWKHKGPGGILEETKSRPFCRCLRKHLKIWKNMKAIPWLQAAVGILDDRRFPSPDLPVSRFGCCLWTLLLWSQ